MTEPMRKTVATRALSAMAMAMAMAMAICAAAQTLPATPGATPTAPGATPTAPGATLAVPGTTLAAPGDTPAVVQQPRPFGYVLGDILTQRVLLQSRGRTFYAASLPPAERAGLWLSRRAATVLTAEDKHRWLVIDYQLINAPQQLTVINLPALELKSKTDPTTLFVPAWPISVAPLTPRAAFAKGGLQDLRPDHPAPELATASLRRQLELWSIAFASVLFVWLAWWLLRNLRAAKNQPFAQAWRVIRRDAAGLPQSWMALHRAFDQTAGRVLQLSTLPMLFKQARQFETQRPEIERFYAESTRRFFGVDSDARPLTTSFPLRSFCATLRRIEKRYER